VTDSTNEKYFEPVIKSISKQPQGRPQEQHRVFTMLFKLLAMAIAIITAVRNPIRLTQHWTWQCA
jgi:hypothetical protein